MRMLSVGLVIAIACGLTACASHRQVTATPNLSQIPPPRPPCVNGGGPTCSGPGLQPCAAIAAGYSSCNPTLGPAAQNGEDANLGYDINTATGNLFLDQPDIHVHPALGPDLNFVRYYNSQGNGADIGLGPNWTHSFSWSITINPGKTAVIVTDTGREILFTANGTGWTPQNGEFGSLYDVGGGTSFYFDKFGTSHGFDSSGRLYTMRAADNYAISITYSSGAQISSVTACPSDTTCTGGASLQFSYSGSHISSISDPTGATWLYGYTSPFTLTEQEILSATCAAQLSQSGTGLLQTVTIPNASIPTTAVHGMILYSYVQQVLGGLTFSPATTGPGGRYSYPAQLTGYAVITTANPVQFVGGRQLRQCNVTEAILGLFSYISAPNSVQPMVAEAASGVVAGQLLRDIKLSYSVPIPGVELVTTVTLNGGSKTITSTYTDPFDAQLASITSTPGTGNPGEMQSEFWIWNGNLTLAEHTDGNGVRTVIGPYDLAGNPTSIVEAFGTAQARNTRISWHPVLSRPLSITTESVSSKPGCFSSGAIGCNTHQQIWDYDQPTNGQFSTNYNANPTSYLYQIVEIGYTNSGPPFPSSPLQFSSSPEVHTIQIQRDELNRIWTVSGPASSNLTTYAYSPSTGYLVSVRREVNPGYTLTTTFSPPDEDGRFTGVTDPNGNITKITYDLAGMVTSSGIYSADGKSSNSQTYMRDLVENVIQRTSADGTVSTEFDPGLRPWRVSGSGGGSVSWSRVTDFDPFGRPVTVRSFSGTGPDEGFGCTNAGSEQRCTEYIYDTYERLVTTHTLDHTNKICPLPLCANFYKYDGNGHVIQGPGDLSTYTKYTRDSLNRVTSVVNMNLGTSTIQYDTNDNVIDKDDERDSKNGGKGGNARDITYTYDDFGKFIGITSPDIGTWVSRYDAAGNLVASKDNSGGVLYYSVDGLNRRTAVLSATSPQDNVIFDYDISVPISMGALSTNTKGRLTGVSAIDSNGNDISSFFSYDYRGRVITEFAARNTGATEYDSGAIVPRPYGFTTTYGWNPGNRQLSTINYPDGLVVTRQYASNYGPKPRISELDVSFGGSPAVPIVSNVAYSGDGRITGFQSGSGSSTSMTWNKRGELTNLTVLPYGAIGPYGVMIREPIWQENLAYFDGSRTGQISNVNFFQFYPYGWAWSLGYDGVGHLTNWSTSNWLKRERPGHYLCVDVRRGR